MNQRRYYIVLAIAAPEGSGTTADCPDGWSGTPNIGRGCYVVLHPTWEPGAPVLGQDVQPDDLDGLTDDELHASLPIEIESGITDDEIQHLADTLGFEPVPVERLLKHKVGGV